MNEASQNSKSPPRLATRFLRWYCRSELLDEVEGDLYELFQRRVETKGLRRAQLLYWLNVLMFFHPDYIRKRKHTHSSNSSAMFRNYFKVTIRGFAKQKGSSFLNITGLAVGLASVVLIFLYIQDELAYDTVHPAPDRTYGLGEVYTDEQGEKATYSAVPAGWAQLLLEQMPEVEAVFRYFSLGFPYSIRNPEADQTFLTQDGEVFLVEASYPEVLHFPLLYGSKDDALTQPNSVVLSEKAARRLFGEVDVVGRMLEMKHLFITDEYINLTITGVMEDYLGNSHIRPDYLMPLEIMNIPMRTNGTSVAEYLASMENRYAPTYVRLAKGTDVGRVETALKSIVDEHLADRAKQHAPFLRKITDFHFDDQTDWSWWNGTADKDYLLIFGAIGLIILLIASINYMNLATAKSIKRSKEVGVRKSLGSSRGYLMIQFFQESVLVTLVALLLALLLAGAVLPTFNQLADKQFTFASIGRPEVIFGLLLIWLGVAVVAGSYPAVFLSGFHPVKVLKGSVSLGKGSAYFRRTLVVVQFMVSVLLIICTGVVLQQMHMLQSTKLYEQADQIVSVRFGGGIAPLERYATLRNEIMQDTEMQEVTLALHLPRREGFMQLDASFQLPEISGEQVYPWSHMHGDYNFPEVFDLELIAGRSFEEQNTNDSSNFLLNESAVRSLNKTPAEMVGVTLLDTATRQSGTIIGIVKDFPYESIRTRIKPAVIQGKPHPNNQILYVKLPTNQLSEKLAKLEAIWKEVLPGVGFDYWFLSDEFGRMYYAELKITKLIRLFSALAVFIACLGLYGLASYTAEQKTKEIGIRKVLGASVLQILVMLITDFLKMVLIACAIALPLGYWLMEDWLQLFVYRVDVGWFVFALSVVIIVALTMITISYESIKASTVNPVDSLRNE
ncbi:MAG: ABC transporter permease [Bacteroidota bacterium]